MQHSLGSTSIGGGSDAKRIIRGMSPLLVTKVGIHNCIVKSDSLLDIVKEKSQDVFN